MRKIVLFVFLFFYLLIIKSGSCHAVDWFYPQDKSPERVSIKNFGILVDRNFYIGKENLFPYNRFYGYHAGVDLEVFPEEQNTPVPFYAVYSGIIIFASQVNGYGGVVIEKLDDNIHNALYGHIKISNLKVKLNEHVESGQLIGYLGEAFSQDTAKERKHLHFALHKSTNLYFLGHEKTLTSLNQNWENPITFLKSHEAVLPASTITNVPTPTITVENNGIQSPVNLFQRMINSLKLWILNLQTKLSFG